MNPLAQFTTAELKAELQRRADEYHNTKPTCKNCKHRYVARCVDWNQSYCDCRKVKGNNGYVSDLPVHSNCKACELYERKEVEQ